MTALLERLGARRAALIACLAIACAGAVTVAAGNEARGATSSCSKVDEVTFGDSPTAAYAPPKIAAALGLMKKYCIKLVSVPIASPSVSLAQVAAGRQDIALLNPTGMVSAKVSGVDVVAITPNTAANGDNPLYIKNNGPIRTLKDFEGKRIQTTLIGSTVDIAMRILLYRKGVDLNKVQFVQTPNGPPLVRAITSEAVAGGQIGEPDAYRARKAGQVKIMVRSPSEDVWGRYAPGSYLVVRKAWADQNKDLVTRIQKAYLEAAMRVQRNPQIFRNTVRDILKLTQAEADGMTMTYMATSHNIPAVIKQVKDSVRFKGIPEGLPDAEIRKLFVPMPPLSSLPKLKALPKKK